MEILFVLTVIAFFCHRSFRVVSPGRSLVVFQNGLPVKVVKSDATRLTVLLPFLQTSKAVETGKNLVAIPEFFDSLDQKTPLVQGSIEYQIVDPIRTINNIRLNLDVEELIADCLRRVLIDATIEQCLNQKTQIESRVIEMSKLKSAALGVMVISVNIKSFPRHLELLVQITTLPCVVYWQIVEAVQ